ncbi:retrovirus-related pol polyprotein from transposon TNT 1-94 [Tanacetum coccineum]
MTLTNLYVDVFKHHFQETIQDGRVTVQQVQGRQTQSFASTRNKGSATTLKGNYVASQAKIVKCYNCLGEGHMAKQCIQPKRLRSSAWFKEKLMLAKTEDLDTYDSDCDDISSAKAVLMANLSSYDSDVLSKEEINTLNENLSNQVKEKESLSTTITVFETECKERESKYMDNEIVLENQNKELENTLCNLLEDKEVRRSG